MKKRCYRNELASLLPPPVDMEQLAWEASWESTKQWVKRTPEEEKSIFWKFEKVGFLQNFVHNLLLMKMNLKGNNGIIRTK